MRRQSPPGRRRRPPPPRRISPLRNQPAPPGEEHNRNMSAWDEPPNNKRARSRARSRPRDWASQDPAFMHGKHHRPSPNRMMPAGYEESYLDNPINNFPQRNHDGIIVVDPAVMNFNSYEQMIPPEMEMHRRSPIRQRRSPRKVLSPRRETRRPSPRGKRSPIRRSPVRERSAPPPRERRSPIRRSPVRDKRSPIRDRHSPVRAKHSPIRERRSPPRKAKRSPSPRIKKEASSDRINRLEKLVEKLVEDKGDKKSHPIGKKSNGIPELIPSNGRFTTSKWLNAIHDECLKQNYDERSCIRFMQDKMTGIMKAWFKSISNYDFTWPELKLLITKTFPDNIDFAQTLKYLVSRDKTPEETITQYFFSKLYLCEACKITGENAVSCLIDGLNNPFMKQDVRARNFLTPEALYSEYLSKYPDGEVHRVEHREVVSDYPQEEYISILEMAPRQQDMYEDRGDIPRKTRPLVPRCLTCKKMGHSTLICRHAPICYKCKKKGHIAAKCHFGNSH